MQNIARTVFLTCTLILISSASAQTLTNFKTDSTRVAVNSPVTAIVDFKPATTLNWCGFYIDWGDGKEPQSFRIGKKPDVSSPVTRKRVFEKPGTYTLKAYGDLVIKGFNTAPKCEGSVSQVVISVYDPETDSGNTSASSKDKSSEEQSNPAKLANAAPPQIPEKEVIHPDTSPDRPLETPKDKNNFNNEKSPEGKSAIKEENRLVNDPNEDVLAFVFARKWSVDPWPCEMTYIKFSKEYVLGSNSFPQGKAMPETDRKATHSFEVMKPAVMKDGTKYPQFRHTYSIYSGGGSLETILGTPNARVKHLVTEYLVIWGADSDTVALMGQYVVSKTIDEEAMGRRVYKEKFASDHKKQFIRKECK
jgi:hypothetical protein